MKESKPRQSVKSLLQIFHLSGEGRTWRIPAGLTNAQVAELWEEEGFGTQESFLDALNDPDTLAQFGLEPPLSEGWILAGTYTFSRTTPAKVVVPQMLEHFYRTTRVLFQEARKRQPDWTPLDIVTLGSIIEKEAGSSEGRRLVSSVFHNRLRLGMRLQSEPTVAYALGNPDRSLRSSDRRVESPYNTYYADGLPPSPICNVSLDSIEAAIYPAKTNYLFFNGGSNGHNYYSETYEEHLRGEPK